MYSKSKFIGGGVSESNLPVFNVTIKDERLSKTKIQQGQLEVAISNYPSNNHRSIYLKIYQYVSGFLCHKYTQFLKIL